MKIKSSMSTEKLEMSFSDCAMVLSRCCSCVQDFANLKMRTSRKALRAEIALAPPALVSTE